jgi:hypothetical protein
VATPEEHVCLKSPCGQAAREESLPHDSTSFSGNAPGARGGPWIDSLSLHACAIMRLKRKAMRIRSAIPMLLAFCLGFFGCSAPGSSTEGSPDGGSPGGAQNSKAATVSGFSSFLGGMTPHGSTIIYSYILSVYLTNLSTRNNITAAKLTVQRAISHAGTGNIEFNASCAIIPNAGSTIYFSDSLGLPSSPGGAGWSASYSLLSVTITWDDGTSQVL